MKNIHYLIIISLLLFCLDAIAQDDKQYKEYKDSILVKTDTTFIKVGGAVRFNTMYTIYEGNSYPLPTENRNGMFWDTWRFEAMGQAKGIGLTFEYRFYPGFNTHFIKKGYLSYSLSINKHLELGVTQVPFGMLEFLGNSWWFQLPYYVGLEDDYDTGIKYNWFKDNWSFHLGYFLMAEPRGVSEPGFGSFTSARYSYDVIPEDGYNGNHERNQGNFRAEYSGSKFLMGVSTQLGEIYNSQTENSFFHWAAALHGKYNFSKKANVKLQVTHYEYVNNTDDAGQSVDYVNMGAYGFGTYQVASEATILSLGLSYEIPVLWGPVSSLTFYEDYSYMNKYGTLVIHNELIDYVSSHHNVLGFLVTAGNIYTYFDIASGINQPWLSSSFGGSALGVGRAEAVDKLPGVLEDGEINKPDEYPSINTRFNINIGYYF